VRYAIILDLDESGAAAVRQTTQRMALAGHHGISVGSVPPHVTLAACRNLDVERFRPVVAEVAAQTSILPINFASLGVFPTEEGVIFLAPTTSRALIDLQLEVVRGLLDIGAEVEPYWLAGQWVPHCTLATGIPRGLVSTAVGRVYAALQPISARLTRLSLVEIDSSRLLYTFDLRA
jgi:2'-5' RNA ligase